MLLEKVFEHFDDEYINIEKPYKLKKYKIFDISDENNEFERKAELNVEVNGKVKNIVGYGNGPIACC